MWSLSSVTELLLVFLVALTVGYYFYYRHCYQYWRKKGVPTSNPLFPIGDLGPSVFGKQSVFFRVHDLYNQLKAKGYKHAGLYFFNGPVYLPIDPDLVKHVLVTDFDHFVDRGMFIDEVKFPLTSHIFSMKGEQWRSIRTKLTPVFTTGKMKSMYNILVKNTENLVKILEDDDGKVLDIKQKLVRLTTDIIGSVAFGIDCNSLKYPDTEFVKMIDKIFNQPSWKLLKLALEEGLQNPGNIMKIAQDDKVTEKYFFDLVRDTIEYRNKHHVVRDDFLNILLQMRDTVGMSFNEIVAQSFLFFTAGFETSSSTMSFCVHELAYNQELQDKLRNEIHTTLGKDITKYSYDDIMKLPGLDRTVKETLRKYPPVGILNRMVVKPYQVPGTDVVLDPGTPVVISALGLQRDPDYFPDPLKFDPERFNQDNQVVPFSYLPFGDGPRNCIGLRFGLMQTKLGLGALLSNFKFLPSSKTPRDLVIDPSTTTIVMNVKEGIYTKVVKAQ